MAEPTRFTQVLADGLSKQVVQGESVLDLTSTDSKTTIVDTPGFRGTDGGDKAVPVKIWAFITTTVAAGNTAPIITIQDDGGNSSGLTLTLTDGDAADDIAVAEISDGTATTPIDLTSEKMEAKVTTAAADAGTAAGECKVFVEYLLVK